MAFAIGTSPIKRDFTRIKISVASPESILARSRGEVLKPETINYRTYKPERDGLMCEKIFGPTKDWECYCGKYKRVRYKGIICDRCGVEVTSKSVRRERMGHISLAVPVVHTWFFRSVPSKIGALLDLSTKELERIIYYEVFVVINPGEPGRKQGLKMMDRLTEEQYYQIITEYEDNQDLDDDDPDKFVAKMGGEAIKALLKRLDLDSTAKELRRILKESQSEQKKADALKRLKVVEAFRASYEPYSKEAKKKEEFSLEPPEPYRYEGNKPEYMVMEVIPVIPPELRPLVPLEGGRFATSDLNDLYRRVIIRNNRLKKLLDIRAPEVILRNEKRMLQEAVDALFDNSRKANAVKSGDSNRALKSLSDSLKGKQGRFRQNLLGKRVDYSGRSVIVVGPELRLHQCGLPKDMAIELFQPFVIRRLVERGYAKSVKSAKKLIDRKDPAIWDVLEKVIEGHPIMLNRAPTLHRLGIQAFQPVLVEGKALQLHPLVCTAFNADFDGDQMAVHIPLSQEAQMEAMMLMLSSHNLILPQSGKPVTVPSQDMVLGVYYLTKVRKGARGEGNIFANTEDVVIAYNEGEVDLHARIFVRYDKPRDEKNDVLSFIDAIPESKPEKRKWVKEQLEAKTLMATTVGRVLFSQVMPETISFINKVLDKKTAKDLIAHVISKVGTVRAEKFLDDVKGLGFNMAMRGGLSIGLSDAIVPETKKRYIKEAIKNSNKIIKEYNTGMLTENEKYNKIVDVWQNVTNIVSDESYQTLRKDRDGFNPLFMMLDSGARGSRNQARQLTGMRGLIARPQKSMSGQPGEIIENPIISNLREGLTVLEYFISTHGARKGLSDTSLKTADAGYLTRRLHDVAQDVIVTEDDCGTTMGIHIRRDEEEVAGKVKFHDKLRGRYVAHDVVDSITEQVVLKAGDLITDEIAEELRLNVGVTDVMIRSVLTCDSKRGICAKCYGTNLASGRQVDAGEAVGVIAAQSIGEPGTQLTLRTFHQGGAAQGGIAETEIRSQYEGQLEFENIQMVQSKTFNEDGAEEVHDIVIRKNGVMNIVDPSTGKILKRMIVPYGAKMNCKDGDMVQKGSLLYGVEPNSTPILAEKDGVIKFVDIEKGVTYKEESDQQTGHVQRVIINWRSRVRTVDIREPRIQLLTHHGELIASYPIPIKANLHSEDGATVHAGDVLAKVPRDLTRIGGDITAGLPRVTELFEARNPSDPAVVSEIDGIVTFGSQRRNNKEVKVKNAYDDERIYLVPIGKHILVNEGDEVRAGDPITDGSISPQDILRIQGPNAVQQYLVNEIQKVYQINAGVEINDKHLEVIVRQMLQKVQVEDSGDTHLMPGDLIDKTTFKDVNSKIQGKVRVSEKGDARNIQEGELYAKEEIGRLNRELRKNNRVLVTFEPAVPATSRPVLLGITSAALQTESFISAASFQETTKVLTDAAVEGKTDFLAGLKENVIVGKLIPAGTGLKRYRSLRISTANLQDSYEPSQRAYQEDEYAKKEDGEIAIDD
ncbi:DNA-directed RNA polymerase, beta' subunit [Chloroherpeton thalassium ATCC 35110]|uniref:DNA-directed RNA polymerase subunit beta' n=1 Tax=Chloroherpeton thalassium (strain ATCC 35110 / GB-78) TaxID=517418 RepID=RPOC_CHLT3|nr:DNA-directed RNA polymerase subunit beta' [Chloroherpeton thalassium]B3QYL5.1 RecName: Full=DNA-directed RNA polymerase subunit beta'; Short=RNAP subunit beta'; AltName: Full=RNA polymerase subunit beta'; AltName: Full=Transcriptase subunit beta' [Chloroherpeton thalassium ATCC 35110]ACF13643.1 DNA-directed RNA polymerase, beta' subunit [Chloroherpeton thalassium ATCC 35110]